MSPAHRSRVTTPRQTVAKFGADAVGGGVHVSVTRHLVETIGRFEEVNALSRSFQKFADPGCELIFELS